MDKIQICGFSGSGKSTFARNLSEILKIDVLYLDSVHFTDNWTEVKDEDMNEVVSNFIKKEQWIIDGNYSKIAKDRYDECTKLFYFNFNRFNCLYNAIKRYRMYKSKTRPDMASGCIEKIDLEFIKWILYKGRTKKRKARLKEYKMKYIDKLIVFNNRKQVNKYLEQLKKGLMNNENIYKNG